MRFQCPKTKPLVVVFAILQVFLSGRWHYTSLGQEQDIHVSDVPQLWNEGVEPLPVPAEPAYGGAANIIPNSVPVSIGGDDDDNENNKSCPNLEPANINSTVPRIIHQTYRSQDLPENYHIWREECKRLNPCWEFKLWTDDDNLEFVTKQFPNFLPIYMGYNEKINRIDSVRYLILYHYGGVYFDLDMMCLRPFHAMTFDKANTFYVASQFDADAAPDLARKRFANAFMAASPRHSVLAEIIDYLPSQRYKKVLKATGPRLLTGVLERTTGNSSVIAFKKEALFSTGHSDREGMKQCATNRTICMARYQGYMISFWSGSWTRSGFEEGNQTVRKLTRRQQLLRQQMRRQQRRIKQASVERNASFH